MRIIKRLMLVLYSIIYMSSALAEPLIINDANALAGLKAAKGVFLIDIGDAKKLNFYLQVIQGTHKNMLRQGVKADFILVYIGPSVKYLSSESARIDANVNEGILMEIETNIEALAELGIRQEICSVATEVFGIKNETVFSDLKIVGDGFISLIGYQSQGYHLVPVF